MNIPTELYSKYYRKENHMSTHTTGEKPGKGAYTCKACGQVVVLDDTNDVLPPCPKCSKTTFKK